MILIVAVVPQKQPVADVGGCVPADPARSPVFLLTGILKADNINRYSIISKITSDP